MVRGNSRRLVRKTNVSKYPHLLTCSNRNANLQRRSKTPESDLEEKEDQRSVKKTRLAMEDKLDQSSPTDIVNLPLDIVFEIFQRLCPLDLLYLARTSKTLRRALMSRDLSGFLWKSARGNVFQLPECPVDLSEPQYANYIFGNHCFECLKTSGTIYNMWDARVRFCFSCLKALPFTIPSPKSFLEDYSFSRKLLSVVPELNFCSYDGMTLFQFAYTPILERWEKEYNCLDRTKRGSWIVQTLEKQDEIYCHSMECKEWVRDNLGLPILPYLAYVQSPLPPMIYYGH